MDWLTEILKATTLSSIGSLASIASLLLTIAVFIGVRNIRRYYVFTARVPELSERLSSLASKISSQLNSKSEGSTREILADIEVTLNSLVRKLDNPLKKQAKDIVKEIRKLEEDPGILRSLLNFVHIGHETDAEVETRELKLRQIHISIYKLTAECKEAYEDARWEA